MSQSCHPLYHIPHFPMYLHLSPTSIQCAHVLHPSSNLVLSMGKEEVLRFSESVITLILDLHRWIDGLIFPHSIAWSSWTGVTGSYCWWPTGGFCKIYGLEDGGILLEYLRSFILNGHEWSGCADM